MLTVPSDIDLACSSMIGFAFHVGRRIIESIVAFAASDSPVGFYFQLRKRGNLTTTRYST
jgi:hypothetical protein